MSAAKKNKSVAKYMVTLFVIALLLLLLAYFMQERTYATQAEQNTIVSRETMMENKVDNYVRY